MIFEKKFIKEHLGKTFCYKCGSSMENAHLETISDAPVALIAHAVCSKCKAESMVTITTSGSGSIPLLSDLGAAEIKRFIKADRVTYDDLLDLHLLLQKESIWNLLRKSEKNSVKKLKH